MERLTPPAHVRAAVLGRGAAALDRDEENECGTIFGPFFTNALYFCCTTLFLGIVPHSFFKSIPGVPWGECGTVAPGGRGRGYTRLPTCQVAEDYYSEVGFQRVTGDDKDGAAARRTWRDRAVQLLKRKAGSAAPGEKVAKRYRTKALSAAVRLDNAMAMQFGYGLSRFKLPVDVSERGDPEHWPRMSLARDEGSDMTCMSHFLARHLNMNIDHMTDFNHAEWNCLKAAVKDCNMWSHLLVFVVAANVDYGPFNEQRFFETLKGSFAEYLEVADHKCPLFTDMLPRILADEGEAERIGCADTPQIVFREPCVRMLLPCDTVVIGVGVSSASRHGPIDLGRLYRVQRRVFSATLACAWAHRIARVCRLASSRFGLPGVGRGLVGLNSWLRKCIF